ncbi:lytic transglycosylase domain-containing protein [Acidiphilium angustum]|uniref:lytic transglycosylase domain-containing protein n=1 Tax=Acidiphilium angustum TaxID=523 RepID=UPI00049474AC|nr:lytic transglycosylase domain-containing protein [Acidiphilium angustum]
MILAAAFVGRLATFCGPAVAPGTLAAIAATESGFNPLAIHDNTTGLAMTPASRIVAISIARRLIAAGHSVDLGLMQINSANLTRFDLTLRSAFTPCASLGAAGRLLALDYQQPASPSADQAALQVAFSRYNTGSSLRGFQNGYVQRVVATARRIVPEINPAAPVVTPPSPHSPLQGRVFGFGSAGVGHPAAPAPTAPAWNIFPRSVGPARLARHRTVTIAAHRIDPAGAFNPHIRTSHVEHPD